MQKTQGEKIEKKEQFYREAVKTVLVDNFGEKIAKEIFKKIDIEFAKYNMKDEVENNQSDCETKEPVQLNLFGEENNKWVAYVDGSYDISTHRFSYGAVILKGDSEEHFAEAMADEELADMRNVAGEIKGAEVVMKQALENKISKLTIYHDYDGIAKWCNGQWKAKKKGTQDYRDYYKKVSEFVKIEFVKVKSHSGDKYNDLADKLAKEAF